MNMTKRCWIIGAAIIAPTFISLVAWYLFFTYHTRNQGAVQSSAHVQTSDQAEHDNIIAMKKALALALQDAAEKKKQLDAAAAQHSAQAQHLKQEFNKTLQTLKAREQQLSQTTAQQVAPTASAQPSVPGTVQTPLTEEQQLDAKIAEYRTMIDALNATMDHDAPIPSAPAALRAMDSTGSPRAGDVEGRRDDKDSQPKGYAVPMVGGAASCGQKMSVQEKVTLAEEYARQAKEVEAQFMAQETQRLAAECNAAVKKQLKGVLDDIIK